MIVKYSSFRLTPTKAAQYDRINIYPGQRTLNRQWADELTKKLRQNQAHEGRVAVFLDKVNALGNGRCDYLMDGQHLCFAVTVSGVSTPCRLHEHISEAGDTKEDVARMFAQYTQRARTRGDIAWIYAVQFGMADWPRRIVRLCNTGVALWSVFSTNTGGAGATVHLTKEENARLLGKHQEACRFVYDILCGSKHTYPRHLLRGPVVALMIGTWECDQNHARLFWEGVRDGEMLKRNDPVHKYRDWLARVGVRAGDKEEAVTHREMFVRGIHWWNASRGGPGNSGRYRKNKPIPKIK